MAATDAGGLHPPVGGQVGRAEAQALHARRGAADRFHVGHAASRLENGVDQQRLLQPGTRLELSEQPIDVVDVFRALHLRHHDHVELVADLADERGEVVERPRRIEAVDPRPELRAAEVDRLADLHQTGASGLLVGHRDRVFQVAQQDVDRGHDLGQLRDHLLVLRREEVDDPAGPEGNLAHGLGGTGGERLEEVTRATHTGRLCSHGACREL